MYNPLKPTLGEFIYNKIETNDYLQEIYDNILYNYSMKILDKSFGNKPVNIDDALRFADILSKSANHKKSEKHRLWAQEIVALLNEINGNDDKINTYATSVLSNIGNYRGLQLVKTDYKSTSFLDELFVNFDLEYLAIPYQKERYFFHSQKEIYNHLEDECFSYSGPTSMGKSLIMQTFIKDKIINNFEGNFAIIVPTKALITEVTLNICIDLKEELSNHHYKVVNSGNSLFLKQNNLHYIFVMTPERLLYTLISFPDISIKYLFIDEAHKISEKDGRSVFYYKVTDMLSEREIKPHIILASPNIPNPDEYLKIIPDTINLRRNSLATSFSPVSQMKYLVDLVKNEVVIYNEHRDKFQHLFNTNPNIDPLSWISQFIDKNSNKQNIIYCGGRDKTIEMAREFAKNKKPLGNKKLNDLAKEIQDEIHSSYYLADLIEKGIAYHVGYLPIYIRTTIEKLYSERVITTLFCTSTLIEGVNLPADNLLVTSVRNGGPNFTPVEFKNLLGRVGRIKYNLYGNVFIIRGNKSTSEKTIKELIQNDVPAQELSIKNKTVLSDEVKKYIINCLTEGNLEFPYLNQTNKEVYSLVRKTGIILLRDITRGKSSIIRSEFEHLLTPQIEKQIIDHFITSDISTPKPDDDINVSVDQSKNLSQAIREGLAYPQLVDGKFDYYELVDFLSKLHQVFKWDTYEKDAIKNKTSLSYYAVVLSQWMQGFGLQQIIDQSIGWKKRNYGTVSINHQVHIYNDSILHKNAVIAETLSIIEDVILFRFANYFLRFSTEYKLQKTDGQPFENDWYEYVEYGSTNELTIFFQRNGFSRETADFIREHKDRYVVHTQQGYKIKKSLLDCSKESVKTEVQDIKYNVPELFIE